MLRNIPRRRGLDEACESTHALSNHIARARGCWHIASLPHHQPPPSSCRWHIFGGWCVVLVFIFSSFADVRPIITPSSIQGHLLAGPLFMTSQKAAQSRRTWYSLGARGESAHQSTSLSTSLSTCLYVLGTRRIAPVRYYTIVPCAGIA